MADPNVPPPPWKATFFITHGGTNTGWSETHYINAASIGAAQVALGSVMTSRMSILNNKYSLVYARLSDMSIKGDGYVTTSIMPMVGTHVPVTPDGGQPGSCIVIRYTDGAGHRVMRHLHGIPEENILDGIVILTTPFATALSAHFSTLISNTFFRRKKAIAPFVEFVPISGISTRYATVKKVGRPFGLLRGRAALRT